ncbi:MAG: hypothetical protein HeimC3_41980 [Candidatus Heimdallarchaeota archaeon LC_3]|nr:MAG: hypothetical protein HeimC3_41980 [Candidatus Heimdallarchaeota archaeon LC_3]
MVCLMNIKDLIDRGQYDEALKQIEKFEDQKEIEALTFRITILTLKGELGQVKILIDKTLNLRMEQLLPLQELNLLLALVFAYIEIPNLDKAKEFLEKARIIINSQNFDNSDLITEEYAYFLILVGWLGQLTPLPDDHRKSLEKSIEYWKKLNNKAGLARTLHLLSQITEEEIFWSYLEESKNLWKELGNEYQFSYLLCVIGSNKRVIGDLNSAMQYNVEALKISERLKYKEGIANALVCIGSNYEDRGDLNQALSTNQRISQLFTELENPIKVALTQFNLGSIYLKQRKFSESRKSLEKCISIRKELKFKNRYYIQPLFYLLQIALNLNDQKEAKSLLQEIENYSIESDHKSMLYFSVAEGLVLKHSKRLKDKIKSASIFEELLENNIDNLKWQLYVVIVKNLSELLIEELKLYGEPEVLSEIEYLIDTIQKKAEEQFQFDVMVESFILRAKLELLHGRLTDAQKYLEKARTISDKYELVLLQTKILQEQDQLDRDFSKWNDLVKNNASMQDRVQQSQLDQYIKNALEISLKDE